MEWIVATQDCLPPKGDLALFCGIYGGIFIGKYIESTDDGLRGTQHFALPRDKSSGYTKRVFLAWLPIPAPYVDPERAKAFKAAQMDYYYRKHLRKVKYRGKGV